MQQQPIAKKGLLLVLWGALTASVGIYSVVAAVLVRSGIIGGAAAPEGLRNVAPMLSVVLPVVALGVGQLLYRSFSRVSAAEEMPAVDASVVALAWSGLRTGTVAMLAVFETVSVAGLVLCLLGVPLSLFLRFVAANLVLNGFALALILRDAARAEALERSILRP